MSKGIILSGGSGSRLLPLTKVTNKSLLPIYNRPMLYWPAKTLVDSGVDEIFIVTGGDFACDILRIMGNGESLGLEELNYAYQSEPNGIAHALSFARKWAKNDPFFVVLGDNIFEDKFDEAFDRFVNSKYECKIFVKEVASPQWYGVVELGKETDGQYEVISIEEKPKQPKSNTIATGIYMYKPSVWDYINKLEYSARRELEVTDLNNHFLSAGTLSAEKINGFWGDGGENLDVYADLHTEWTKIQRSKLHA